jgi:hypothetical protein
MAEEMIRDAECSVITFGPEIPNEAPAGLETILFATDFYRYSGHGGGYMRGRWPNAALRG